MTTVRFTAPQLEMFARAHPHASLEGLIDVTFVFDQRGRPIKCHGTVDPRKKDPMFVGNPWLSRLCAIARRRFAHRPADGTAAVIPLRRAS